MSAHEVASPPATEPRRPLRLPWREAGVVLMTAALLLLPWFLDHSPPPERPAIITGLEFLTHGAWVVMLGYGAAWLAYALSRFTKVKWAGMIALVVGALAFFWVHLSLNMPHRWDPAGLPLGRSNGPYGDVSYPALAGVWVNWLGLLTLALGVYLAETGRGRAAVRLAGLGALLGFGLVVASAAGELSLAAAFHLLRPFWPAAVRAHSETWYVALMWLQILGLPVGGALAGAWLGLKPETNRPAVFGTVRG